MNKKTILIVVALAVVGVVTSFSVLAPGADAKADGAKKSGLVGGQYGSEDFTNLQNLSRLSSLERAFTEDDDYGREWSAKWVGFIVAPASGKITFRAETDRDLQIQIESKKIVGAKQGKATESLTMVKGKEYPIEVSYVQKGDSYDSYFKVTWSWSGQEKVSIPTANLMHTAEQEWVQKAQEAEDDDDDDDGADLIGQSLIAPEEMMKRTRVRLKVSELMPDNKALLWKADYFPSFADQHTVALWLFDETPYAYNTLTDAGIYEYDLRLFSGQLVPGKFGNALKTSPGSQYNLYYAEWMGKVCKVRMRRPKGEPSGLWGPTIAPKKILEALSSRDWTIEFWLKCLSKPDGEVMVLDMGHAYEPGVKIVLDSAAGQFRIHNVYAGYQVVCPTNTRNLFDDKWRHIAFTWSAGNSQMRHYLDGREQTRPSISTIAKQPVPETIIPSSFVRPDGYEVFDKSADAKKFRLHRFNLSIGEGRHGAQELNAMFDEFRVSNIVRYSGNFNAPKTFSRNYGPNAPQPAVADGPPLLFAPDSPKGVVRLGSRKHLFIDDVLLGSKQNVRLVCNPPRNRQELNFWPEKSAWRPSVVDVDGKIYLYAPESYGSDKGNTHLRISTDGLNFTRPNLGLYEFEGSTDNALVISHRPLYGNFFKDTRPTVRPEEKYKMTAWLSNRGVYLYVSPDGIHWRRNETAMLPIISGGDAETYWDDQRSVYVTFLRRDTGHYTKENPGHGRAAVYFDTSEVFKTWGFKKLKKPYFHTFSLPCPTGEGPTIFKENKTGQVYRTRAIKYPWAPDTYLAFPWRFKADDETRRVDLGVSRDGLHWKFYAHQQWYVKPPEGSDEVLSMYGLIRRGDQIWQYIDEGGAHGDTKGRSKPRIYSRVIQRLDGFVSLDAGKTVGTAVTRPFTFEGNKLTLNVAATGKLLVEIQDEKGSAIAGFSMADCDPIQTDSIRHVVSWKGNNNLTQHAGKSVRLKFQMQDAKVFALQFSR